MDILALVLFKNIYIYILFYLKEEPGDESPLYISSIVLAAKGRWGNGQFNPLHNLK